LNDNNSEVKPAPYLCALALWLTSIASCAGQPLVGIWHLDRQEVNGTPINAEPMTLKIAPTGDKLSFAFSVPVNNVYFVSMSYTAKLDGSEADVKNSQGDKVGTIQITPEGASQYKIVVKGANRPDSSGKLTVSPDGKTLTSESDTTQKGPYGRPIHSRQLFSRE
jgi:hypothetical protein